MSRLVRLHEPNSSAPRLRGRAHSGSDGRRGRWGAAFTLPAVAFLLVFFAYPLGQTVYLSFTRYDFFSSPHFIGLRNYSHLLHDEGFRHSLAITAVYVLASGVPVFLLAMVTALVIQHPSRLNGALAGLFFLPVVVSDVVVAIVWKFMLAQTGPVNQLLNAVGLSSVPWISDPKVVPWAVVAITTWQWTGWTAVIFLAGLRTIPSNLYEAARIDGAQSWQMLRDITLPLLRPTIFFVVSISLITGAQSFGYQYVISNGSGGPAGSTDVISLHIYNTAFRFSEAGYAAAMSVTLLVVLLGSLGLLSRLYPSEMRKL